MNDLSKWAIAFGAIFTVADFFIGVEGRRQIREKVGFWGLQAEELTFFSLARVYVVFARKAIRRSLRTRIPGLGIRYPILPFLFFYVPIAILMFTTMGNHGINDDCCERQIAAAPVWSPSALDAQAMLNPTRVMVPTKAEWENQQAMLKEFFSHRDSVYEWGVGFNATAVAPPVSEKLPPK